MRINIVTLLNVDFDNLTFEEVKARLARVSAQSPYRYIVTPNVDHLVRLQSYPQLRSIYESADLCVCDSRILAGLARLQGDRLQVVPGSDLTEALFADVIRPGDRIAIVGGDDQLISELSSRYEGVEFRHHAPPMGLDRDKAARRAAAKFVATAKARFTFLAVGSPQQELIALEALSMEPSGGAALCVGASLDFITGRQRRAPRALRSLGLEWAHRLVTNPRRLWRRYLVDGVKIFPIYARHARPSVAGCTLASVLILLTVGAIFGLLARGLVSDDSSISDSEPGVTRALSPILPAPDLLRPLSPEEAAKKNAERPFVARPDKAASSFRLVASPADVSRAETCLAQAIYYEAAGEGIDGGRAVAQIVLNRLRHPAYPESVCGVVFQGAERATGCQFSFTCDGSLRRPPNPSGWAWAMKLAQEALSGRTYAPVGHATHFHANYVLPYWADSLDKTVQIGRHIFYRLRGLLGEQRIFTQRYAGSEPAIPAPDAPVVIASPDADQLIDGLLADAVSRQPVGNLAPLNPNLIAPNPPLEADRLQGTLIADSVRGTPQSSGLASKSPCDPKQSEKQLRPIRPASLAAGIQKSC